MSETTFSPITPSELQALVAAAAEDKHTVLFPTHVIRRGEEIVGYLSICATPIVNVWAHSKKVNALQSVRLMHKLDDELKKNGVGTYIMPCSKDSPYYPHMQKLGYSVLGENVWHFKQLQPA